MYTAWAFIRNEASKAKKLHNPMAKMNIVAANLKVYGYMYLSQIYIFSKRLNR